MKAQEINKCRLDSQRRHTLKDSGSSWVCLSSAFTKWHRSYQAAGLTKFKGRDLLPITKLRGHVRDCRRQWNRTHT